MAVAIAFSCWASAQAGGQEPAFVLQSGHRDAVTSVAISPDGRKLASGSWDNTVKLWDLATARLIASFAGHTHWVNTVAFSPDAQVLASAGSDGTLRLWDVAAEGRSRILAAGREVTTVAFSPTGLTLAAGKDDGSVDLWEVATRRLLHTLEGHGRRVSSVAFSPDGFFLAAGFAPAITGSDPTIKIWHVATATEWRTLAGHAGGVSALAFSPDGKLLASGGEDDKAKLWELATGTLRRHFDGGPTPPEAVVGVDISAVAFSPDGQLLAVGGAGTAVKIWQASTGTFLRSLEGHFAPVTSLAFTPDGKQLVSGSGDKSWRLWQVETGAPLREVGGQADIGIDAVDYSPAGGVVAATFWKTIVLWDSTTGVRLKTLAGHTKAVSAVDFSPDGRTLASGGFDDTVLVWEVASGKLLLTLVGHSKVVTSVAFSPDGLALASADVGGTIRLWDATTGRRLHTLEVPGGVKSVTFSPDSRTLASGGGESRFARFRRERSGSPNPPEGNNAIRLWDVATGEALRKLEGHAREITSVAFSPDGRILASGSGDWTVRLWEVNAGTLVRELVGNPNWVSSLAFSPDGQILASGRWDNTVRLWEVTTGKELRNLYGHTDLVNSVAFAPDGQTLVSGSNDGTIRYWRLDGDLLATSYMLFENGYLTYTTEGLFVASNEAVELAAWRIDGQLFGFEQYAERFNRPDLVAQRLAGLRVQVPGDIHLRNDRPPTLRWPDSFATTSAEKVQIVLSYEGTTKLDELIVFFNGKLQPVAARGQQTIEIPLTLSARRNQLSAVAFDSKRLRSTPLEVSFEYLTGADADAQQLVFAEPLPPELLTAKEIRFNRQSVQVVDVDPESRSIRVLGPAVPQQGLNWIEATKQRWTYWLEEKRLHSMPEPYKTSYAILVAIDDYDRQQEPVLGPTGFDPLGDMVRRAQELETALVAVGFPRQNIRTLYDRQATSANITAELQRFWEGGDRAGADRLFFYFGGHGSGASGRGYLITYDFDRSRPATTSLRMNDIMHTHFPEVDVKHMLVALDACSSGLAIPGSLADLDPDRLRRFRQLTVVFGDTEQRARNLLVAGTGDERAFYLNGGIFTRALIAGLRQQADWNQDGVIQFEELALHIKNQVRDEAARTGVKQVPAFYSADDLGKGRILFLTPQGVN